MTNVRCVLDMDEREIDGYLEMMERALIGEKKGKKELIVVIEVNVDGLIFLGEEVLDEYFPLSEKKQYETRTEEDEGSVGEEDKVVLKTTKMEEGGEENGVDVIGRLVNRAASWVGVSAESIVTVVDRLERRGQRHCT